MEFGSAFLSLFRLKEGAHHGSWRSNFWRPKISISNLFFCSQFSASLVLRRAPKNLLLIWVLEPSYFADFSGLQSLRRAPKIQQTLLWVRANLWLENCRFSASSRALSTALLKCVLITLFSFLIGFRCRLQSKLT